MAYALYKKLRDNPSAPEKGFSDFAVGGIQGQAAQLRGLLQQLVSGDRPSLGCLILGPNGNGKTLLNHQVRREASDINLGRFATDSGPARFKVLFSRVSLSQARAENVGVELAKNLQRSILERSESTYATIAIEIFRRYADQYRSPWRYRWLLAPLKGAFKKAIRAYDDYLKEVMDAGGEEFVERGLDKVFERIHNGLIWNGLTRDFRRFSEGEQMGAILRLILENQSQGALPIGKVNKAIYDELGRTFSRSQPQDIVRTLAAFGSKVGCEVLVLEVDDCNTPSAIDFLLPIAEHLGSFNNPRVLVVASAVDEVWDEIVRNQGKDLSVAQKIDQAWRRFEVSPPTESELFALVAKLEALVTLEAAREGKELRWPEEVKNAALHDSIGLSFREATRILLTSATQHI